MTLKKSKIAVSVDADKSGELEVIKGLKEDDSLSTVLFSVILDKIIRKSGINRNSPTMHKRHQCLVFHL